ncbi:NUMOD4 domain-containing protein, partial [Bacteroides finegoldii]
MTNQEFIQSITIEEEEWRDVIGFEGLYMVSSLGR